MSFVELNDIEVSYDGKSSILKDLQLSIEKGELVSLLGPSGCGKTTTLRVIAGLIQPKAGAFLLNQKDLTKVPVHKRHFGMVFQSYALFPHMTVAENVAFGLKLKKEEQQTISKRVADMLVICGLDQLGDRYPKQLSGGQRQRVALARALVIEPALLLLDEPLSNLDAKLRITMRVEIKRIQQQLGITTVFVTHDQEECFSISDKVAIMNRGVIEQFDTPEMIYRYPKTQFVAEFIGFENFIDVQVEAEQVRLHDDICFASSHDTSLVGEQVITIRPDDIVLHPQGALAGKVLVRTFLGKSYQYDIETAVGRLLVNGDDQTVYQVGDHVKMDFPQEKLIVLKK